MMNSNFGKTTFYIHPLGIYVKIDYSLYEYCTVS